MEAVEVEEDTAKATLSTITERMSEMTVDAIFDLIDLPMSLEARDYISKFLGRLDFQAALISTILEDL